MELVSQELACAQGPRWAGAPGDAGLWCAAAEGKGVMACCMALSREVASVHSALQQEAMCPTDH